MFKELKALLEPGLLISILGMIIITLTLALGIFTIIEKVILFVIGFTVILGGILYRAGAFNRFMNYQEETWN